MSWLALGLVFVVFAVIAWTAWRNWGAPWRQIRELAGQIARGERPRTFLVDGAVEPKKVALALEGVFTRQEQLQRQSADQESGTQTILRAMQDGLLVVDRDRRVILANEAFRELFKLSDISPGSPLVTSVRDATLDGLIGETLVRGTPKQTELVLLDDKTNNERRVEISAVPIKDDVGLTSGAVILFHDITQLKKADNVRRDFVANVSHELRTPLSILRGYIETLLDDPAISGDELVHILKVMERHSRRLGLLVDDLLTLAQLESSSPNLQLVEVSTGDLFKNIIHDWEKRLAEKKLTAIVDLPPDPLVIRADETRLEEVLHNLFDNAVKYSPDEGEIHLCAERRGDEVILSVSDKGSGISRTDLPRIFERFYRADKARSRELGGTGLGLAIVKHIVQLHNGRVEAESDIGQGTTIRIVLPAIIA